MPSLNEPVRPPRLTLADPCPGKFQKGKHSMYGAVCRACGARDEKLSDEVMAGAEKIAARKNFWLASESLDLAYANRSPDFLKMLGIWRTKLADLRKQGGL